MANIYVIDDDDQLLRMVGLMLERGGHNPTLFSDPNKGLEKIKSDPPEAVVLDVMMPHMSGHDICRQIRADDDLAHLPILVLTARAQSVDREAALESGANDYLTKPVNSQELIERIDDLLTQQKSTAPESTAVFVSFMGLRGGIGRTTLAVNLAGALRRISQEEVCLVELTPSVGQASMHLRIQARTSWFSLPEKDELDWESLKKQLTLHPTGLRLLSSPLLPQSPIEPSGAMLDKILQLLGEQMSAVIIDLPAVFNPAFRTALTKSDMILHVVTPEVVSVQLANQTNRALAASGLQIKPPIHILNQIWPEGHLPAAAVERGLNSKLAFQIGYDANQHRALAQGVPLTLTSAQSPLPVTMRRMAEVIWQQVNKEQ